MRKHLRIESSQQVINHALFLLKVVLLFHLNKYPQQAQAIKISTKIIKFEK
jgi:hypothetical protein